MQHKGSPIALPHFPPRSPSLRCEWQPPVLKKRPYTATVRLSVASRDYCSLYVSGYQYQDHPPFYRYLLVLVRDQKITRVESNDVYRSALKAMESAESLSISMMSTTEDQITSSW